MHLMGLIKRTSDFIVDFFTPFWNGSAESYDLLISATYFYPRKSKNAWEKVLKRILFYTSVVILAVPQISHGFFLNYKGHEWPRLAKLFSYHPNLPFIFKIFKVIGSIAIMEVVIMRCYMAFLYFFRRQTLVNLLKLDNQLDPDLKSTFLEWTKRLCFNFSAFAFFYDSIYFTYGWSNSDFHGKVICIIITIPGLNCIRHVASDLYLLYSYVICIASEIIGHSSDLITISDNILLDNEGLNHFTHLRQLKLKHRLLIDMIDHSRILVSTLSSFAKVLVIPLFSLVMVTYFQTTSDIFVNFFRWSIIMGGFVYSIRVYVLNAYLSILQKKSKTWFSRLSSIIARCKLPIHERKILFRITEDIASHYNSMVYRDTHDGIIEQWDVLDSFSTTFEIFLLLAGLALKK